MGALPLIPVVTNETGTYEVHDEAGVVWTYGLTVSGLGTKSEHHIGVLRINDVELHGAVKGVRVNTPWSDAVLSQFLGPWLSAGWIRRSSD